MVELVDGRRYIAGGIIDRRGKVSIGVFDLDLVHEVIVSEARAVAPLVHDGQDLILVADYLRNLVEQRVHGVVLAVQHVVEVGRGETKSIDRVNHITHGIVDGGRQVAQDILRLRLVVQGIVERLVPEREAFAEIADDVEVTGVRLRVGKIRRVDQDLLIAQMRQVYRGRVQRELRGRRGVGGRPEVRR